MLKQNLEQRQKLAIDVQQIQQIKLLEVSGEELADRIREELSNNPALEIVQDGEEEDADADFREPDIDTSTEEQGEPAEELSIDDYTADDVREDSQRELPLKEAQSEDEEYNFIQPNEAPTLADDLWEQLITLPLSDRERTIAEYIIGNLNDDGYLKASLFEISNAILFNENMEVADEEILSMIAKIRQLDPAGVATENLQESLLEQIGRLAKSDVSEIMYAIVQNYFEDLAGHRYERIIKGLDISEAQFSSAQQAIKRLNPRPANGYGTSMEAAISRIVPDFTVHLHEGELQLWLNDAPNLPKLGISPAYLAISQSPIKNETEKVSREFASSRITEARRFIDALKRRRQTLLHVVGAIVQAQSEFFRSGDIQQLRPLVLREISEIVNLDISSISRITQRKYIQSDYGIYPLKFLFSEGVQGQDGESISSRSTKEKLRKLIEKEDKRNPLSDTILGELLSKEGVPIARRTIAKYREQLGIPIARLRKEL